MTETLDRFALLSELVPDDRRALAEFLTPREIDAGSALFRATEEAEDLYLVTQGALAIRVDGQPIAELGAGEAVGALCLVSVGKRECDAIAAEATQVLCLSRESYLRLRADLPALALQLQEAVLRSFVSLVRNILDDQRVPSASVS
jgi:NTE family protein